MLCESSNLDKLSGVVGSGGGGCEESSDSTLSESVNAANPMSVSVSEDLAQTQAGRISLFRNKGRLHPNIHHRPTIHPKDHYQRPLKLLNNLNDSNGSKVDNRNNANANEANENDEEDGLSQNECSTSVESSNYHSEDHENDDYTNNFDDLNAKQEFIEIENSIRQTQELIERLNLEIFKNPQNYTRPPSEYLEIFNEFTEKLHHLQIKKQQILDRTSKRDSNEFSSIDKDESVATFSLADHDQKNEANFSSSRAKQNELNSNSPKNVSSPVEFRKPPLPPSKSTTLADYQPTTTHYHPPLQTPTSPHSLNTNGLYNYKSISSASSPVTTPGYSSPPPITATNKNDLAYNYNIQQQSNSSNQYKQQFSLQQQQNYQHQQSHLSTSTSSSSLPSFVTNHTNLIPSYPTNLALKNGINTIVNDGLSNLSHNSSRSFTDINDPLIQHPLQNALNDNNKSNNNFAITPSTTTSMSPVSSLATTPTSYTTLSSSFLRIFFGTNTAVIEKKPIPLKDALSSKLKSRSLEIDKCIAYQKDTNIKVDWDYEVSKLSTENLVIADLGDEIRHSFEKKTFSLKSCDSCKKRLFLNAYTCVKCDYTMCQRNECRTKSERFVCVRNKSISGSNSMISSNGFNGSPYGGSKQEIELKDNRSESPHRANSNSHISSYNVEYMSSNISEQILPVNQLKVFIPSRDRSRSETELNLCINPTEDTCVLVTDENEIEDISGSVNEESGSVISSISNNQNNNSISNSNNSVKMPNSLNVTHHLANIKEIQNDTKNISQNKNEKYDIPSNAVSNANPTNLDSNKLQPGVIVNKMFRTLQGPVTRRDSFNSWEIPFKQIKIDQTKKIGSGSFGIVHQGTDYYHGTVAIKFLNVQNPTHQQSQAFRNEVLILKSTRHDNILSFIGCILKPYLAIVTEWCSGSSLYRHVHVEEEHWEMHQLVDLMKQTATGMEYLHARDILHRDLKSNNIFLIPKEANNMQKHYRPQNDNSNTGLNKFNAFVNEQEAEKWTVKIGDFGLATVKSTWTQTAIKTNQPTGSILWMAPEVITQKVSDPYTQKSDVYSYGVVLYELVTGKLPFDKKEQNMILFLVGSGRLKLNPQDARSDTPDEIKDLIVTCSQFDRDKRLDFVAINQRLKNLRLVKLKPKLQRAQSVPNVSSNNMTGLNLYDDEIVYTINPSTPKLTSGNTINKNNINSSNKNSSQLITNM